MKTLRLFKRTQTASNQKAFVMPTVIFMMVIIAMVAYAALVQANNVLNLSYKQSYIGMARVASKAGIDYAQEQFDTNASYNGTTETNLVSNAHYRLTFTVSVLSTSGDGYTKTIRGTGSVYLPKLSMTAQYVFDIRSEIIRTYAITKLPSDYAPVLWLDASNPASLYKPGTTNSTVYTSTSNFGNVGDTTRNTVEERVDNGTQGAGSWASTDLEMHTCDSTEYSNAICSNNATKYLYDGIIFSNVNVPKNSTISSAIINYDCAAGGAAGSVTHRIYGLYKTSTNPHLDLFTSSGTNQVGTPYTTNGLHTTAFLDDSTNNCPPGNGNTMDVTNITQEMVNNANWDPTTGGGRMGFGMARTAGSGNRKFSKDNIRLVVTYTSVSGPSPSTASGDSLGEWHDISGNGNHAYATHGTQPTRQDNALNGKTVVRFAGNGDMLSTLSSALTGHATTIMAVIKPNSSSATNARLLTVMNATDTSDTASGNSLAALTRSGSGSTLQSRYFTTANVASATNAVSGSAGVMTLTYASGETPFLRYNGTRITGVNTTLNYNANQVWIAGMRSGSGTGSGANYTNGDYAEIVVYNYRLTCNQITGLEETMRVKWGLAASAWTNPCPDENIPTL